MADLPTGTVTFLFTDLESSTRLWEEYPDAMQSALARHDEILRDAITAHGGHVVKTTGDGVHAAFAQAPDALLAAREAQRALATEHWEPTGPLRVRMGVHTGPAEVRDGDYFGTAVNRAARIMSIAHGCQVLVSLATEELTRDELGEETSLLDLGEHGLRDLGRPERVFQLEHPDLPREFPRLRSLDAFRGNLPLQTTSFVGRETELGDLAGALRSSRLVTVTGVGGVGKTRLAVQAAAEFLPEFADGAWLCELAAASDPDAMHQVIAAALGVQPRPGATLASGILDFLRSKELLLVLDNCEHLLDAAAALAEGVLRECPSVRVLATSREGLAVAGEQVWPLRSLADDQAAELFSERAQSVAPNTAVDARDAAVSEICRRLDGIPLAIELAAARVVALGPAEIVSRIDERFRLLTGGRRTAVERHQTLRATVDWSYSMLDERDQLVFLRLGVFAGSFDVAAAEAIATGDGIETWDVIDAVTDLAAKSMIVTETTVSGTRYRLLETLRAYARERLDQVTDPDVWRRRHAEYFAAFAEVVGPSLRGPDELEWRARLVLDLDNLRAAVMWSVDGVDPEDVNLGGRIVAALAIESQMYGALGIGAWADRLELHGMEHSPPATRAGVFAAAAWEAVDRGDVERASRLGRDALRERGEADIPTIYLAYMTLACIDAFAGRSEPALVWTDEARREVAALGGDSFAESAFHGAAAFFASASAGGEFTRGKEHADAALRAARASDNPSTEAAALGQVGYAHWVDDPDRALAALIEAIDKTAGAMNVIWGPTLSMASRLEAHNGDLRAALVHLREAVIFSDEAGDDTTLFSTYDRSIRTFAEIGNAEVAAELAGVVTVGPFADLTTIGFGPEADDRSTMLERARAQLGDDRYDHAVARGARLAHEEIRDRVLSEIDRMLAESGDE